MLIGHLCAAITQQQPERQRRQWAAASAGDDIIGGIVINNCQTGNISDTMRIGQPAINLAAVEICQPNPRIGHRRE